MSEDTVKHQQGSIVKGDEIDLVELVKVVWSKKWFIAKVAGFFAVLGLIIAFTSPEEYSTSSILIPETAVEGGNLGGQLGGLASLAGVNLGGIGGASQGINPALYQSISRSTPFLMDLMSQRYYFAEVGDTVSLFSFYYEGHYKTNLFGKIMQLPGIVIGWIKGVFIAEQAINELGSGDAAILTLDEYQTAVIADLAERVYVEMDWDLNVLTIQVEMQDPVVAAQMALYTQAYITQHVTDYAISKSTHQLASVEKQYQERKKEFEEVQYRLASFRDRNQNVTTSRARSQEEKLQSEYNLAFNVYNQLAQQREAIRLQIDEETPVFTVLEPVKVPVEKSKPRRALILLVFSFLGSSIGTIIVLLDS